MKSDALEAGLLTSHAWTGFSSKSNEMQAFFHEVVQKMNPEMRKIFAEHPKATKKIVEMLGAGGYLDSDFKDATQDEIRKFNRLAKAYPEAMREVSRRFDAVEKNGLLDVLTGSGVPQESLPCVACAPQDLVWRRRMDSDAHAQRARRCADFL
mmetsp:Transcript_19877/g.46225  ORF Transcript_19877/g.46225 Transcript_19877/m.46225 type:complete len:153 (-) Transcript_19877:62-520(-)